MKDKNVRHRPNHEWFSFLITPSVSNYRLFDFVILNLTTYLIQNFVQNTTSFVVAFALSIQVLQK